MTPLPYVSFGCQCDPLSQLVQAELSFPSAQDRDVYKNGAGDQDCHNEVIQMDLGF